MPEATEKIPQISWNIFFSYKQLECSAQPNAVSGCDNTLSVKYGFSDRPQPPLKPSDSLTSDLTLLDHQGPLLNSWDESKFGWLVESTLNVQDRSGLFLAFQVRFFFNFQKLTENKNGDKTQKSNNAFADLQFTFLFIVVILFMKFFRNFSDWSPFSVSKFLDDVKTNVCSIQDRALSFKKLAFPGQRFMFNAACYQHIPLCLPEASFGFGLVPENGHGSQRVQKTSGSIPLYRACIH